MVRTKDPRIRSMLIERAARMLGDRQPVTLRALVKDTKVSTMAVYTYFDGLDGLWMAVRQEGFKRLAAMSEAAEVTADPVRDLASLGSVYTRNALENPDLYRVMFDATVDLEDPGGADAVLQHLVLGIDRAKDAGRFRADVDSVDLALQAWIVGHGLVSLVATGPLDEAALAYGASMLTAVYVAAGDDEARCRESVAAGWEFG
ncbi:TetR family transcriptional regulator [Rhodococcus sp. 06-621-2]|nr:TetR/AcrR family transcriptional regulator [Rhodococcus sp. 06-621-2]OZC55246.1 TetR family transcriptional regulator [Rhodococcus sp. 06-621-2]